MTCSSHEICDLPCDGFICILYKLIPNMYVTYKFEAIRRNWEKCGRKAFIVREYLKHPPLIVI